MPLTQNSESQTADTGTSPIRLPDADGIKKLAGMLYYTVWMIVIMLWKNKITEHKYMTGG